MRCAPTGEKSSSRSAAISEVLASLCRKAAGFAGHFDPMRTLRSLLAVCVLLGGAAATVGPEIHDTPLTTVQASLPVRLDAKDLRMGEPVFIRLFKEESELELWMRGVRGWALFQNYPICRWSGSLGPKLRAGDRQAPEGFYRVSLAQLNPNSRRYRAFNIGFPNEYDRALGRSGSYLMVHGGCTSAGCFAMTDAEVDDIYRLVNAALLNGEDAVDVHAFPFRMSAANIDRHVASRWLPFWRELQRGYDLFEETHEVPVAAVQKGHYVVFAPAYGVHLRSAQLITAWR